MLFDQGSDLHEALGTGRVPLGRPARQGIPGRAYRFVDVGCRRFRAVADERFIDGIDYIECVHRELPTACPPRRAVIGRSLAGHLKSYLIVRARLLPGSAWNG